VRAKGYTTKYICAKCGKITTYIQYGIKSDMMRALRSIVDPPFCYKCATTSRMDVLRITSELCINVGKKYSLAWRCDKCYSRWSTNEQLERGQKFSDLGMTRDKKPICIRSACASKPENIRITSVSEVS